MPLNLLRIEVLEGRLQATPEEVALSRRIRRMQDLQPMKNYSMSMMAVESSGETEEWAASAGKMAVNQWCSSR